MAPAGLLLLYRLLALTEGDLDLERYRFAYSEAEKGNRVILCVGVERPPGFDKVTVVTISSWDAVMIFGPKGVFEMFKDVDTGQVRIRFVRLPLGNPRNMPG